MYIRRIKLGVMCKIDVFRRDWRQEEELRGSAVGQTRENKHERESGPEDGQVEYNTDAMTFKGNFENERVTGPGEGFDFLLLPVSRSAVASKIAYTCSWEHILAYLDN